MPPKAAKTDRPSGILPVSASARAASAKQPAARLKLEIRRLPPGLTLTEFEETIGDDWKLGNGKVDWREYRQGKIRSPGKLPEQSRCYIHLTNEVLVKDLEQRFLTIVFHDKAGTHKNLDLRHLPPTLAYAPNQRVPLLGKQRVDNRQGTIDQDPEFIAFLEAETQPVVKPAAIGSASLDRARDEVKVDIKSTPLIDDLREKKASKAKAAASKAEKKGHKRGESKDAVIPAKEPAKGREKVDAAKLEQAAKEAAKVLNKKANSKQAQPAAEPSVTASPSVPASPARKKKREQAAPSPKPATAVPVGAAAGPTSQRAAPVQRVKRDTEGIKKMLQKDLGIKPRDGSATAGPTRTRGAASATQQQTQTPAAATTTPRAVQNMPKMDTPTVASASVATTPKAFLKHANPSQGMTEALIQQALSQYSDVVSVTIDTRKGTAITVFKTIEDLQKAIAVKKIAVANGAVEVQEFKERSAGAPSRGGFRGGARGRGRGNTPTASATPSQPAT